MKARKKVTHNNLVADVHSNITLFKAQPQDIKKSIEDLIVREYIMRDENNRQTYIYIP